MLLAVLVVNSLYLTITLQADISNLYQYRKNFEREYQPDLNERFNIPPIIKAIQKPRLDHSKFRKINNDKKSTNKRNAYFYPYYNNPDYAEVTNDEYSRRLSSNSAGESRIHMSNLLGNYNPRPFNPMKGYSVLSLSSGMNHGTKLEPVTAESGVNLRKQKNTGVLQMEQILNPNCKNFREEFIKCGCERTCTNIYAECIYKPCDTGCFCRNGWVRDTSENCVLASYYCKNPLKYFDLNKNAFGYDDLSFQESRPLPYIQLQQSSRITPVQFNKPPVSLICSLPQERNNFPETYFYPEQDYYKLKRAVHSGNDFRNRNHPKLKEFKNDLVHNREANVPLCNENEEAVRCTCERTCDDRYGTRCQLDCENGCVCKDGFVRINKECYHVSACGITSRIEPEETKLPIDVPSFFSFDNNFNSAKPSLTQTTSFPRISSQFQPVSKPNNFESFNHNLQPDVQVKYEDTDYSYSQPLNITSIGMNDKDGITSTLSPEAECFENQEFLQCGCERTCDNQEANCNHCTSGCFCKIGFVRNNVSQCVQAYFCPVNEFNM